MVVFQPAVFGVNYSPPSELPATRAISADWQWRYLPIGLEAFRSHGKTTDFLLKSSRREKEMTLAYSMLNPRPFMLTIQQNRVEEKIIPLFNETVLDLQFPCGVLGFEQVKNYKLHAFADLHPFLWLEGQSGNGLCFLVVPPSYVVESYGVELTDEDVDFLGLRDPDDAIVLNIATFHPNGSITVNLKGPIIYNRETLVARQVVPKNAATLSIKHPLGN